MDPEHDVINDVINKKSGPEASASKLQEISRKRSDDEISIVDSDGPTITRARPGYEK